MGNIFNNVSESTHIRSQLISITTLSQLREMELLMPNASSNLSIDFRRGSVSWLFLTILPIFRPLTIFKGRALLRTCLQFRGG